MNCKVQLMKCQGEYRLAIYFEKDIYIINSNFIDLKLNNFHDTKT